MKTKTIVLSAVVVLALLAGGSAYVALGGGDDDTRRTAALSRSYTSGNFFLEIDGANVGALKSVGGCGVKAETVNAVPGSEQQPGPPTYEPCTVRFGTGMGAAAYQWISDALSGKNGVRNAAIVTADASLKAQSRLELDNAILTKFTFPALNAATQVPAYFELELAPEQIRKLSGGGSTVASGAGKSPKQVLVSNFRVTSPALPGLKPSSVDAWSFEIPVSSEDVGAERLPARQTGQAKLGDVSILAAEPNPPLDTLVNDLTAGKQKQTTLVIELLDPTLTTALVELKFAEAGLSQADLIAGVESGSETIAKRGFSMFVDGATLKVNAS